MARMIPPKCYAGASDNEHVVFDLLESAPGTQEWVVMHQVDIADHVTQVSGEADFIVVIPRVGVVFLEVKGYVRFVNGEWFFGRDPVAKKSPFAQAKDSKYSVLNWANDHSAAPTDFPFCSGCVFVQTPWNQPVVDFHPHQLLDAKYLAPGMGQQFVDRIIELVTLEVNRWRNINKAPKLTSGSPTIEQSNAFVDLIRPYVQPPRSVIPTIWSSVERFTKQQFGALDYVDLNRQVIFTGLAGTGKTVLAAEVAVRQRTKNRKVLLICYNELARKRLEMGLAGTGVVVAGISELAHLVLGKQRFKELLKDESNGWRNMVTEASACAERLNEEQKFDFLIIDEAQDLLKRRLIQFIFSFLKEGVLNGKWAIFADPHQWIFRGEDISLEEFSNDHPKAARRNLLSNCRNTERIAEFANTYASLRLPDAYDPILVRNSNKPEHPSPTFSYYVDAADQVRQVRLLLNQLAIEGYGQDDIVVLSRRRENSCAQMLSQQGYELTPYSLCASGQVRFETLQRFKGLESIAVLLTDIDQAPGQDDWLPLREFLYTGITRAVYRLDCFAAFRTNTAFTKIALSILEGKP